MGRKRGKNTRSKLNLAGLVAGDSDSSALTQESGDEGAVAETPRESVVTGTDGGTEYAEDEDTEMREPSPGGYLSSSLSVFIMLIMYAQLVRSLRALHAAGLRRPGAEDGVGRREVRRRGELKRKSDNPSCNLLLYHFILHFRDFGPLDFVRSSRYIFLDFPTEERNK